MWHGKRRPNQSEFPKRFVSIASFMVLEFSNYSYLMFQERLVVFVAIIMITRMMILPVPQDQLKSHPVILVIPGESGNTALLPNHQNIHVKFTKNEQRGRRKPAASLSKMFSNRVMMW
jgi:hypothetical protein